MKNKFFYISLVISLITVVINIIAYPYLPNKVPVHWGINGDVNRYGSKLELVMLGVLPLIILLMQKGISRVDPNKLSYTKHARPYWIISLLIVLFLSLMNIVAIINALGYNIPFTRVTPILLGLLFIGIGNYSTQIRHNYFIGFKTPWALASEYVWTKTHRFGGYVFVGIGLIPFASLFMGAAAMIIFFIALLFGIAAIYLYSYQIFKKSKVS
jgi:uncharacterized membrane protein